MVASKRELADLMQRLARPALVVAKQKTVGEMQKELLLDRVRPAIQEIWPSSDAPIQDFDALIGYCGCCYRRPLSGCGRPGRCPDQYRSERLRTKLGIPDLTLKAERIQPARAPGDPHDASLRVLFFTTLSILVFNFYPLTAVMIVMLALLNDEAILSIAYDNVHY